MSDCLEYVVQHGFRGTARGSGPVIYRAVVSAVGEVLVKQGEEGFGYWSGRSPSLIVVRVGVVSTSSSVSSEILLTGVPSSSRISAAILVDRAVLSASTTVFISSGPRRPVRGPIRIANTFRKCVTDGSGWEK